MNTPATPAPPPEGEAHTAATPAHHRPIRSFVLRAGRTTTGQARALAELGPRFIQPYDAGITNLVTHLQAQSAAQGRPLPRAVLEIGFGMGQATAHIAAHAPDTLFIGCEVHAPGVGALLKLIGEQDLRNIRIVQHDAVQVLTHMIAPGSLHGVHIYFPDPWHKKRHHKRRLIQPPLVQLLATRLAAGGYLHCATDWQPYAEQMLQVLGAEPQLRNTSTAPHGYADRPAWRPETKFERRGQRLGHGVWDLVFEKTGHAP